MSGRLFISHQRWPVFLFFFQTVALIFETDLSTLSAIIIAISIVIAPLTVSTSIYVIKAIG